MTALLLAQAEEAAAAPVSSGLLDRISDDQLFVVMLVAIGCTALVAIISLIVIGSVWNATKQRQIEGELKQDMLDRGMNAAEIEQVVKAQPKEGLDHWMEMWAKKKK